MHRGVRQRFTRFKRCLLPPSSARTPLKCRSVSTRLHGATSHENLRSRLLTLLEKKTNIGSANWMSLGYASLIDKWKELIHAAYCRLYVTHLLCAWRENLSDPCSASLSYVFLLRLKQTSFCDFSTNCLKLEKKIQRSAFTILLQQNPKVQHNQYIGHNPY